MKIALICAIAASPVPSLAADQSKMNHEYSRGYTQCMDRSGGGTPQMLSCISDEHDRWDTQLNAIYRRLIASLPPDRQARLRSEERVWVRRQEHACDHAGDDEAGGTLQLIEIDQCALDETVRRTLTLRAFR